MRGSPLIILLLLCFLVVLVYVHRSDALSLQANKILATCAAAPERPTCYDKEIPKLMDAGYSMEDAFLVTRLVQQRDSSYKYCHVLGHLLASKETAKDPSKWKDVVTRSPMGVCSNGAIHGAFQERFRTESLSDELLIPFKEELMGVCDARGNWSPTGMQQGSCIHALGHLLLYVTAADFEKSLTLCDELSSVKKYGNMKSLCYDGVFMQLFQPLEPDDFSLIAGKEQTPETVSAFCGSFARERRSSCISESASLFRETILSDPSALIRHCGVLPAAEAEECTVGLIYYVTALLGLSSENMESYCAAMPLQQRRLCFAHAANRFIEVDWNNIEKAVSLCAVAEKYDSGDTCFSMLVELSSYQFHSESREKKRLCSALPSQWTERCQLKK